MSVTNIERLLKPYIRDGVVYTDYYKSYGMDRAALFISKTPCAELLKSKNISRAVFADIFDFKFLEDYKGLKEVCVIFTKNVKRDVDLAPLFMSDVKVFIINENAAAHVLKSDLSRFAHLQRISATRAIFDEERANSDLVSLKLSKINNIESLTFLSNFVNLRYLVLENGVIENFCGLNFAPKLNSVTLHQVGISDSNGLSGATQLKNLSVKGIFPSDIIDELCLMEKLEFLELDGYVEINDVEWVRNLKNLKVLILGCVIKSNDLTALQSIPYVRLKIDLPTYNLHDSDLSKELYNDRADGFPRYDKFCGFDTEAERVLI